jgi:hypothetical protein
MQDNIETSKSHSILDVAPTPNSAAGTDTLVEIPDVKEEGVAKTKDLQPEREATFKDYLVCSSHHLLNIVAWTD